ncbi:MAG TPA: RNA-binding protein [Thermoanaerobaculia bacterium]|nr:RNA-binding protein [Thermoanaerobaculia bacterium]
MSSKVFVGNLDFNTTKTEVQTLFAEAGEVRDVYLPTDRESGRPRGFAFVEFASEEQAAAAIQKFNGYQLSGRTLRVNAAEDRPRGAGGGQRSFGAGRGYSGGGGFGGGGGEYEGGGGGGGGYGGERFPPSKPKGSRRNIRGKKRSL